MGPSVAACDVTVMGVAACAGAGNAASASVAHAIEATTETAGSFSLMLILSPRCCAVARFHAGAIALAARGGFFACCTGSLTPSGWRGVWFGMGLTRGLGWIFSLRCAWWGVWLRMPCRCGLAFALAFRVGAFAAQAVFL